MDIHNIRLSDLKTGEEGIIVKVLGHGSFRKRITEMGFVKGKSVKVIKNAPLQDPIEYLILGYNITLRRTESLLIEVVRKEDSGNAPEELFRGTLSQDSERKSFSEQNRLINVALVGNPNSGKTTLFNYASGSRERVGNYGGVTVDSKKATIKQGGFTINISDLPGTYSITEYTPEELFVRNHIFNNRPDIVINVIDGSNLERNLYLTTQLIDMNIRVIIALNMHDEMEEKGIELDHAALGRMIGIPLIPTVAARGKGIRELFDKVIEVYEEKDPVVRHIHINYGSDIEMAICRLQSEIRKNKPLTDNYSSRYLAIKLLENDRSVLKIIGEFDNSGTINGMAIAEQALLEKDYNQKSEGIITDSRYGFIAGALRETMTIREYEKGKPRKSLDHYLTHKFLGFPIFILFMWLMFQATFTIGSYPMEWIEKIVAITGNYIGRVLPDGAFSDLLTEGIIGGVGGVIVFLPNILILFFFISLMEDTGYMARVSFIMDKLMHLIGLHGKSFIPLLMGFGCNVPAIMASRTLENRKDRIITMLITPLMSCSARLPVYILIISAFFTKYQGLILVSIYLVGIILAGVVALLMNKTIFRKQDVPFVMELPPYRMPTLRNSTIHMWYKGSQYLRKMGTTILVASVVIWVLSYYPKNVSYSADYDSQIAEIKNNASVSEIEKDSIISHLDLMKMTEKQEQSYIGRLGHLIEPALRPIGFDWKIGVSILTGLAAKEIVVSTMGILYQADSNADEKSVKLITRLQQQEHRSGKLAGKKVFTKPVAMAFMMFILIYFPCVAVVTAIKKESELKWAVFTVIYSTALAWIVAFIVYNAGNILTGL